MRARRTLGAATVLVDEVANEEGLVNAGGHDARARAIDVVLHRAHLEHIVRANARLHRHEVAVVDLDALEAPLLCVAV